MSKIDLIFFIILALFLNGFVFARTVGQRICHDNGFFCLKVKKSQSWRSLFPDEHDRSIVMRVNRMNTQIWAGSVIAIPENLSDATIMDFSPFPQQIPSPLEKLILIDPREQAWAAYNPSGYLVRWGPASSGSDYCKDIHQPCHTPSGSFRIFSLGSSDCYSTKFPRPYGGAPMPYCMYFDGGQALHGEPNGLPGFNASHGCVRLYLNDAEWLRYDFVEGPNANNNYRGTRVIVRSYESDESDESDELS